LKAAISNLIYRKLKQLRVELRGYAWGTCSGPDSSPRPTVNVLGLLEILPRFTPNGD